MLIFRTHPLPYHFFAWGAGDPPGAVFCHATGPSHDNFRPQRAGRGPTRNQLAGKALRRGTSSEASGRLAGVVEAFSASPGVEASAAVGERDRTDCYGFSADLA